MIGKLDPHGEEARLQRNDGLAAILRDAVLRAAPQDEVREICQVIE